MKLTKETIEVLKNFSEINNSINNDEPGVLKTVSPSENIFGICDIQEELPDFAIYNLTEFLGILSLFDSEKMEIVFKENFLGIRDGNSKVKFHFADLDHIPNKCKDSNTYKAFDDFQASIDLTKDNINSIMKSASVMTLSTMNIVMQEGKGKITILDPENPHTNNFEIVVKGKGNANVSIYVENLKLIEGDYTLNISEGKAIRFNHGTLPLFYFVSVLKEG